MTGKGCVLRPLKYPIDHWRVSLIKNGQKIQAIFREEKRREEKT